MSNRGNTDKIGTLNQALDCTCSAGKISEADYSQTCWNVWPKPCDTRKCTACPPKFVPSQDGTVCLQCDNSTRGIVNNDCKCPPNMILTCLPCSGIVDSSGYACLPCGANMVAGSTDCHCITGYMSTGVSTFGPSSCISQANQTAITSIYPLQKSTQVTYQDFSNSLTMTFTSALMEHYFLSSAINCYYYSNEDSNTACQVLGNLCVLQMFDPTTSACALLQQLAASSRLTTTNGMSGWSNTLPFLLYGSGATSVLTQTSIQMTMSFSSTKNPGTYDKLQFIVASYSMNGTFLGFSPLSTQLLVCDPTTMGNFGYSSDWLLFGFGMNFNYGCDLSSYFNMIQPMMFYELYLVDKANNNAFIPVPIRVKNYRDGRKILVNQNSVVGSVEDDQLTHRFFLVDGISGIKSGFKTPTVVTYASSLSLIIQTQASNAASIYVPCLTIQYTDTLVTIQISTSFQVQYKSNTSSFWSAALALFVTVCILSCCSVILQYYSWQRRNTRGVDTSYSSNFSAMFFFGWSFTKTLSTWTTLLIAVLTSYYLLFFKLQSAVYTFLPEYNPSYGLHNEYAAFEIVLTITAFTKTISILGTVYSQSSVEMFFIDWEKARETQNSSISIWRTILIANEWNELQTARGSSLSLTLFGLLWLLYGCDYSLMEAPQPAIYGISKGSANEYLRFANVFFWWLVLTLSQWLWRWLIYERWITEPKHLKFIDVCTLAKVSCILLDEEYHGYYLHCRSPYAFADGTMLEMTEQLKQEEAGLTASRALQGGPEDCQAFEIFVTKAWRRKYMKLYGSEETKAHQQTNRFDIMERRGTNSLLAPPRKPVASQNLVMAGHRLNEFLKHFVDNHDDTHRWKMIATQTCMGRFFGIPPEMGSGKISLFVPDISHSFTKALFLGLEAELMLWNILIFSLCDLWWGNHAISALCTYICEMALISLRRYWGHQNLSRRTLVDYRFLW
ncbi:transmembrane protein [Thraustotheca clavata]|uniref:Transmembrane protein n=1 Tax=Thraustotheca clavata TaxID=74557 RepID=A0A1W0A6X7_9STRA|nr:transmembrane protein [Thraustotheca clavata]